MKTSTKLGIIGLTAGLAVQIGLGIWEISDYRKGKRRLAKTDAKMIAEAVVAELNPDKSKEQK